VTSRQQKETAQQRNVPKFEKIAEKRRLKTGWILPDAGTVSEAYRRKQLRGLVRKKKQPQSRISIPTSTGTSVGKKRV